MKSIILDYEGWDVCVHKHTPAGQLPDISAASGWEWRPASLPFDAVSWLAENGLGPEPTIAFNDMHYKWVEDVDWVLRQQFVLPAGFKSADDDLLLAFNKVDCFFEAFLNGKHIGGGQNQFREQAIDVDEDLFAQENELIIYIRSAKNVTTAIESAYGPLPAGFDKGRVHARRCQSVTGWDWTTRLSSVAIMQPPRIRPNSAIQLHGLHVTSSPLPAVELGLKAVPAASVSLALELGSRRRASGTVEVVIREADSGQVVYEANENLEIKPKPLQIRRQIEIPEAKLWWPLGMGDQPLYECTVSLKLTDKLGFYHELEESVVFGVRNVTVARHKDGVGESFQPTVNGHAVFCRGANWVPADILPARANYQKYATLLAAAAGAGMNCVRVWGGGIYESDDFYDMCDKLGILVWQDFMFASAAYPTYREFLEEVEAEATYQVKRLRNHPCLLLWCGNSEIEWLHQTGDLRKGNEQKVIGETIWTNIIRQVVEDHSPDIYYHQSSPYGRSKTDANDICSGDRHCWDVWGGWQSADELLKEKPRFVSEFGVQGLPAMETLSAIAPYADSLYHPELLHHQRMFEGHERLVKYVSAEHVIPSTLEQWVKATQEAQAFVLGAAVDVWRLNRGTVGGALIWQLNDAWSALSWSLIDCRQKPKAAYDAARSFFAPVSTVAELLINGEPASAVPPTLWPMYQFSGENKMAVAGGDIVVCATVQPMIELKVSVCNDTSQSIEGTLRLQFAGINSEEHSRTIEHVRVAANGTAVVISMAVDSDILANCPSVAVKAEFQPGDQSRGYLVEMGEAIRTKQRMIWRGSEEELAPWLFNETDGLAVTRYLVSPRYRKEPEVTPVVSNSPGGEGGV